MQTFFSFFFQRSLSESSPPVNKDSSSSVSMSRESFAVNSNSSIVKPAITSNAGPAPNIPQTRQPVSRQISQPVSRQISQPVSEKISQPVSRQISQPVSRGIETAAQEINKVKEVERSKTIPPSTSQVPQPVTPRQTTTTPTGERVIAGPNSCFNPALLRQSRLGPPAVPSMAGTRRHQGAESNESAPTPRPGRPARREDPTEPGGRARPAPSTERQDAGDCGAGVRPANCRQAAEPSQTQPVDGGIVLRHSFEGVKQLLVSAAAASKETPRPEVSSKSPETVAPPGKADDLKGFFTMPDTSQYKRPPSEGGGHRAGHRLTSACHRSPRSTNSASPSEAELMTAKTDYESNREVMIKEWLSSGKSGDCHQPIPSGAHSDEDQHVEVKPVARSRSSSAHSTVRRQSSAANDPPTGTYSREVVRLRMRYNLTSQTPSQQTSLFQRTNKVPSTQGSKVPADPTAVRHTKSSTPTRYPFKYTRGGGMSKPPPSPDVRKPLFTGLRHVNFKPQAITATVTKTTLSSTSVRTPPSSEVRNVADQQAKAHSAGALPRISYRHRMSSDLPSGVRTSRVSPLLAQLNAESQQCFANGSGE